MTCEKDGHKFYVCMKGYTKDPPTIHIWKECTFCIEGVHHAYQMPSSVFWVDTPDGEIKE